MRRRDVIAMTALLAPGGPSGAARAFAQSRPRRVGILVAGAPDLALKWLPGALRDRGHAVGGDLLLVVRSADDAHGLAALAAELVALGVDIIVATPTPAAFAALRATATIPIVAVSGDAVAAGLTPSLARPGGNLTGVSLSAPETAGKLLDLIKDALPAARKVAALVSARDPLVTRLGEEIRRSGGLAGLEVIVVEIGDPGALTGRLAETAAWRPDAVVLHPTLPRKATLDWAFSQRVPVFGPARGVADDGGLVSYTGDIADSWRMVADFVDLILKGAKPADLPMRQPTRFELVVNLKTARALGLSPPPAFLARADEVIE